MCTTEQITTVAVSALVMLGLDAIYLKSFGDFWGKLVKKIQGSPLTLNIWGAIVAYLAMIVVLNVFILLQPKIPEKKKYILSLVLGLCIYLVYEGTNMAIIKNWNWTAMAIDGIWGGLLFLITTFITVKLVRVILKKK